MVGAFFDIDGTLYRNSLLIENFKKLVKYEIIDQMVWLDRVRKPFLEWAVRKGDYENYLEDVSLAYQDAMVGLDERTIDFLADQTIEQNWEKTYVYTRNRIHEHLSSGHKVVFISGSPDFLVAKMAAHYGVKDCMASRYVFDANRRFTGEVLPMWDAANKKKAIHSFVAQYQIDLEASFAYGDTSGDLTMLEMVGHPVAFNPNRNLFNKVLKDDALKKRVRIVVERKDMIYRIDPDNYQAQA